MERLTDSKRNSDGTASSKESLIDIEHDRPSAYCGEILTKLADYEDLEEQGRLIKLPIEDKKGDCRECVHTKTQCHHMEYKCSECPLTELFCDEFYLAIDRCYEDAYANGCLAGMDLAKSEAEEKLSEMKKNESEE